MTCPTNASSLPQYRSEPHSSDPTPVFERRTRHLRARRSVALWIGAVLCLITALASPAGSGITTDQRTLEAQEAELQQLVGEFEIARERLDFERSELIVDVTTLTAAIDSNADAQDALTRERVLQARARIDAGIDAFVGGGTAEESFTGDRRLQAIDAEIRSLQAENAQLIADRVAVAQDLTAVDAALFGIRIGQRTAEGELAVVTHNLEFYRDVSSRSQITGRPTTLSNDRPALVVKIDNVPRARPQAAINQADLVFVEMVEGGVTRLAATFHSQEVGTVGPVRSMRTTDVALLRMLNRPLFANSGANQRTTQIVNDSPLVNIGAATNAGGAYYRNGSRPVPHNLFTSTQALRREGGDRGGVPPQIMTVRRPGTSLPHPSQATNGVDISYPNTPVQYRWNGSGWARTQDGRAFVDIGGARVAPETVIVRFTPYGVSPADANSPEARVTGTGVAWIFTEGRLITGTWTKPRAQDVTIYRDSDGDEIELLPGRVWIEIPPPNTGTRR